MTDETRRLVVDRLTKSFPQPGRGRPRRHVLDAVSFTAEPGEFVSVIGPSGCGKSTIFSMLAGLDVPDSGSVTGRICPRPGSVTQKAAAVPTRHLLNRTDRAVV